MRILKWLTVCGFAAWVGMATAQDAGEATYKQMCAPCHGVEGAANTPAGSAFKVPPYKDPAVRKTPDANLIAVIENGRNKMPAFGSLMTEAQIKAVVAYIHTLQK